MIRGHHCDQKVENQSSVFKRLFFNDVIKSDINFHVKIQPTVLVVLWYLFDSNIRVCDGGNVSLMTFDWLIPLPSFNESPLKPRLTLNLICIQDSYWEEWLSHKSSSAFLNCVREKTVNATVMYMFRKSEGPICVQYVHTYIWRLPAYSSFS